MAEDKKPEGGQLPAAAKQAEVDTFLKKVAAMPTVRPASGRGRLIFGVGRSGLPRTYEDYGVSYAESRDRFAEVLDIVEQAWTQPTVCYEGRYYSFKNIAVAPKPVQQPLPPIRIAAASPDTYPAVGKRGLPIFLNARHGSFSEFAPAIREYREAYKTAGHPGTGQVYLRVPVYLAETEGRAREEPRESLMHFYREQTERLRDSMSRGGTRAIEGRAERLERLGDRRRRGVERDRRAAARERLQRPGDQEPDGHQAARDRRRRARTLAAAAALTQMIGGSPSRTSSHVRPSSREP